MVENATLACLTELLAQLGHLGPLRAGQPIRSAAVVDVGLLHPGPHRRLGQIELAGHAAHSLAGLADQLDYLRLELVTEGPSGAEGCSTASSPFWTSFRGFASLGGCPSNGSGPDEHIRPETVHDGPSVPAQSVQLTGPDEDVVEVMAGDGVEWAAAGDQGQLRGPRRRPQGGGKLGFEGRLRRAASTVQVERCLVESESSMMSPIFRFRR